MNRSNAAVAALAGILVFAAVVALRTLGLLQGLELILYDGYVRRAAVAPGPSSDVVIVEVTERDIREQGHWPLSDRTLAETLRTLLDAGPRVVGVDVYRDLPVPPGSHRLTTLFRDEPRIIAVSKFGEPGEEGIEGPPTLRGSDRVGFNDMPVDPDGTVRRGLLFQDDGNGSVEYAFALRVALRALVLDGVTPAPDPERPEWLRLGPTTIRPLGAHDGGYSGIDDAGYQYLVDFSSAAAGLQTIALGPLLRGEVDADLVRDKVVLLGVSAYSLPDFHRVPFRRDVDPGLPGVQVHGHMVRQLLGYGRGESRPMRVLPDWQEAVLVALLAALGCVVGLGTRRGGAVFGVSAEILLVLLGVVALWFAGFAAHRAGWWIPMAAPGLAWLASAGAVTAWTSRSERAQRATLMQLFSRHVSSAIADEIWSRRDEFFAGGRLRSRRMTVTVLFLDMKGYTSRAEKLEPQVLMDWVNEFLAVMAARVDRFGGVVEDYFGDGLKASFGIPFARESESEIVADARRAVDCALAMKQALAELDARYRARNLPTVAMRIGIHTGQVLAGSLGEASHLKYSVVGDVVITAQRLEGLESVEHDFERSPCRILVSERTRDYLDESYACEPLGFFALKGKGEGVAIHRVSDRIDSDGSRQASSGSVFPRPASRRS